MLIESKLATDTLDVWWYVKKMRHADPVDQKAASMLLTDNLPRLASNRLRNRSMEALRKYNNDQIIEAGAS